MEEAENLITYNFRFTVGFDMIIHHYNPYNNETIENGGIIANLIYSKNNVI